MPQKVQGDTVPAALATTGKPFHAGAAITGNGSVQQKPYKVTPCLTPQTSRGDTFRAAEAIIASSFCAAMGSFDTLGIL